MAGHSKWANIRHRKARQDAKKGKIWSKCAKAIIMAAKNGPDPELNLGLRYAIEEAKSHNMPKDNIKRAIERGSGTGDEQVVYEEVRYEGYGPAGVAVIVDALTDNRQRTAPDVRSIFGKAGGNLGASGCVAYNFESKGIITLDEATATEDQLMEIALEAGAENVELEEGTWTITTAPEDFLTVKGALDAAALETTSGEVTMLPNTTSEVAGDDVAKVVRLIDALEDNDDVQKVYTNMDASAEDLEAAAG